MPSAEMVSIDIIAAFTIFPFSHVHFSLMVVLKLNVLLFYQQKLAKSLVSSIDIAEKPCAPEFCFNKNNEVLADKSTYDLYK